MGKTVLNLKMSIFNTKIGASDHAILQNLVNYLKMIGKGFVLFKINSSPSAFYIIKPTCIVIGF